MRLDSPWPLRLAVLLAQARGGVPADPTGHGRRSAKLRAGAGRSAGCRPQVAQSRARPAAIYEAGRAPRWTARGPRPSCSPRQHPGCGLSRSAGGWLRARPRAGGPRRRRGPPGLGAGCRPAQVRGRGSGWASRVFLFVAVQGLQAVAWVLSLARSSRDRGWLWPRRPAMAPRDGRSALHDKHAPGLAETRRLSTHDAVKSPNARRACRSPRLTCSPKRAAAVALSVRHRARQGGG
jgi:hypothetical protein